MTGGATDLQSLLIEMDPHLSRRQWCFQAISSPQFMPETAFALIREEEGLCCVLPAQAAERDAPIFAKVTLRVQSSLTAIGLTAAVSAALAQAGIACNVIAGLHHDHVFVPWENRKAAFEVLETLSLDSV